jgi:hypothetical protein
VVHEQIIESIPENIDFVKLIEVPPTAALSGREIQLAFSDERAS